MTLSKINADDVVKFMQELIIDVNTLFQTFLLLYWIEGHVERK